MTTPTTTSTITTRWLREVRPTKTRNTLRQYGRRLSLMTGKVPTDPAAVLERHLRRWLADCPTAATFNAYLSTTQQFWKWACRRGYCPIDPAAWIERAKMPAPLPRAFTVEEAGAVMLAAHAHSPRLARAVTLMVQEGLRVAEVAAADWAELDTARRRLVVHGKGYGGRASRVVPLSKQSTLILGTGPRRGPIVPTPDGGRYQAESLGRLVTQLIRDAIGGQPGDGRTAHALRHTAATHMVDEKKSVRNVQRVLGHASVQTTERYTMGAVEDLADTVDGRWYGPPEAA